MYLALARDYFKTGSFTQIDPYLYTLLDSKWVIMHQWLGYFIYYGLYHAGGFDLIIVVKTLLVATCLALPLVLLKKNKSVLIWSISIILSIYAMSFRLMERTSLFSDFLVTAVLLLLLLEQKRPSKLKYSLPFIFIFWVNVHPIYPIGWLLCFLFLLCQFHARKVPAYMHMVVVTVLSVLVTLLNPAGLSGVLYPFQFAAHEGQVFRRYYFEWMPTFSTLYLPYTQTYFIAALILFNSILLWLARKKKCWFEVLASILFITFGIYAIRFVPTMCIALVMLNTSLGLKLFKDSSAGYNYKNWRLLEFSFLHFQTAVSILLIFMCLGFSVKNIFFGYHTIAGERHFGLGLDKNVIPVQAAESILQSPQIGNIFNSHMFGSYLVWAWAGQRKVFYHGFVTDTKFFLQDYAGFSRSFSDFHLLIEKYQIKGFLLDRFKGNERLIEYLVKDPAWGLAFQDESSLIFISR